MSEVVTGDAVVLDVQIAQLPVRAVSALIDITRDIRRLSTRADAVGGHPDPIRRSVDRGHPDHLHGAGDGRVSPGIRNRDAGTIGGQDHNGTAGGVRRRRPRTIPAGAVSCAGVGGGDLDARRESRGDLQHIVAEGQTYRRHLRRHSRSQRARSPVGAAAGDAAVDGVVGVVVATIRPERRPGRGRTPIPLSCSTTRSQATPADGLPDRRRCSVPHRPAATAWRTAGAGPCRRACRTTPPRTGATSTNDAPDRAGAVVTGRAPRVATGAAWARTMAAVRASWVATRAATASGPVAEPRITDTAACTVAASGTAAGAGSGPW